MRRFWRNTLYDLSWQWDSVKEWFAKIAPVAGCFGLSILFIVTLVVSTVWGGYVLSVLLNWFLVPYAHLHPISLLLAMGFALIIRLCTYNVEPAQDPEKARAQMSTSLFTAFALPLLYLIIGAIIHNML